MSTFMRAPVLWQNQRGPKKRGCKKPSKATSDSGTTKTSLHHHCSDEFQGIDNPQYLLGQLFYEVCAMLYKSGILL